MVDQAQRCHRGRNSRKHPISNTSIDLSTASYFFLPLRHLLRLFCNFRQGTNEDGLELGLTHLTGFCSAGVIVIPPKSYKPWHSLHRVSSIKLWQWTSHHWIRDGKATARWGKIGHASHHQQISQTYFVKSTLFLETPTTKRS